MISAQRGPVASVVVVISNGQPGNPQIKDEFWAVLGVMVITRNPATGARRPSIRACRNLLRTSLADPTGSYSGL